MKQKKLKGKSFAKDNLYTCKLISATCGEDGRKLYELSSERVFLSAARTEAEGKKERMNAGKMTRQEKLN